MQTAVRRLGEPRHPDSQRVIVFLMVRSVLKVSHQAVTEAGYETTLPKASSPVAKRTQRPRRTDAVFIIASPDCRRFPCSRLRWAAISFPACTWVERTIGTHQLDFPVYRDFDRCGWTGMAVLPRKACLHCCAGAPDMNFVALGTSRFDPTVRLPSISKKPGRLFILKLRVIVTLYPPGRLLKRGHDVRLRSKLAYLQPATALWERGGKVVELPLSMSRHLYLRPGARVATDGNVIDGQTFIDA
jgi:Cu+-exporting ATPase